MRYLLMDDSKIKDQVYDTLYKDCLTVNFNNIQNAFSPVQYELTAMNIERLDLVIFNAYNDFRYLDVVLEINNIAHRDDLKSGYILLLPSKEELDKFVQKRRK